MPASVTHHARTVRLGATAVLMLALASCGGSGTASVTHSVVSRQAAVATSNGASTGVETSSTRTVATALVSAVATTPASSGSQSTVVAGVDPAAPHLAAVAAGGGALTLVVDVPSGPFGAQNDLIRQGVSVAAGLLNASGGIGHHQLRVVPETLDGATAGALAQRVKAAGPNPVLVLPCDSNSEAPLADAGAQAGVLELAPCSADPTLASKLRTYWPVGMDGAAEAQGLVTLMSKQGFGRVFVIDASGLSYATTMSGLVQNDLRAARISVLGHASVGVDPSAADISRVVAQIRATRPKPVTVYSTLPPPGIDTLMSGLHASGVTPYLFATSTLDIPLTLASSGHAGLEQAIVPSYGFSRETTAAAAFQRSYQERYGHPPIGAFPGLGFETVGLLEQAVAKARSTTTRALQSALSGGLVDNGAALFPRTYNGTADHNPQTTVSFERLVSDTLLPLLTIEPDGSAPPPAPTS